MEFTEKLMAHEKLGERRSEADRQLSNLRTEFAQSFKQEDDVCVYCAGSLGRGDVGKRSDLDLFILAENEERKYLEDLRFLAKIIDINEKLEYPEFSNDGQFLAVYSREKMLRVLGQPDDDSENTFTVRMLMLLESKPIYGEKVYEEHMKSIIHHYFRDDEGGRKFTPLFLLNDLLRYWRTLCLNYERIRNQSDKPWHKKNINLKFSRMITVFGTVLPMISCDDINEDLILALTGKTPLERFSGGLDALGDKSLLDDFDEFLDVYEEFLGWKEDDGISEKMAAESFKRQTRDKADFFSNFIYEAIFSNSVDQSLRKYLVI